MARPILLLTGMTPDPRIFRRILPQLPSARIVPWIVPPSGATLSSYARALAATLPDGEQPIICGVSFGGMVARELAWRLNARCCVQISSVTSPRELPPWLRCLKHCARWRGEELLELLGVAAAHYPPPRSHSTLRLAKLSGDRGRWYRWATNAVLQWRPRPELAQIPLLRIHGDCDTTFPIRYLSPDIVIKGGGHVLPLSHSAEIVDILQRQCQ